VKPSTQERTRRIVASVLWAAWADAVGFITELADEELVQERLNGRALVEPVNWKRRVGGRFGVEVPLPAGCYSDDTQLRLATGRAVSDRGFDVEAFARVELTVWPTYALGGGRASKAAATNLSRRATAWFGNFFDGWSNAGGNGAAMRIQPHVWAAENPARVGGHLLDVVVNGVTTHGHPRALVGAVLHAASLGIVLETGEVPRPRDWSLLLEMTQETLSLLKTQTQVESVWLPTWEATTEKSFHVEWQATVDECERMLGPAARLVDALADGTSRSEAGRKAYERLILELGLAQPSTRGSGTATAVAALALASGLPGKPGDCALLAALALGTDTDTIGTMAAALAGATGEADPPSTIADRAYLRSEALRFAGIGAGRPVSSFSYPDLLNWTPPRSQLESVGTVDEEKLALAGLGWLQPADDLGAVAGTNATWSWMRSDFGQTFLVKHRQQPRPLPRGNHPVRRNEVPGREVYGDVGRVSRDQLSLGSVGEPPGFLEQRGRQRAIDASLTGDQAPVYESKQDIDVDQLLVWVARRRFKDDALGFAVRQLSQRGTLEQLIAFAGAVRTHLQSGSRYDG
jgi:ADP-ribosylglycohydrolase